MSHFGRESRSSLAPRAAWVIEGDHHRGRGRGVRPRRAAAASRRQRLRHRRRRLQAASSLRGCATMLSHTGACGRAGKRAEIGGDEKDIPSARSSSSAAWSGGLSRRSKLCNGSAAPAALQPFPVSKARRRYTNLTVWLPPHVTFAAEQCLPPSAAACISAAASPSGGTFATCTRRRTRRRRVRRCSPL